MKYLVILALVFALGGCVQREQQERLAVQKELVHLTDLGNGILEELKSDIWETSLKGCKYTTKYFWYQVNRFSGRVYELHTWSIFVYGDEKLLSLDGLDTLVSELVHTLSIQSEKCEQ